MQYSRLGEEVYYLRDNVNEFFTIFHFGKTLPRQDYHVVHMREPYHLFEYVVDNVGYVVHGNTTQRVVKGDFYYLNKNGMMQCYADHDRPYEKYFLSVYGKLVDHLVASFYDDHNYGIIHTGERSGCIESTFSELCGLTADLNAVQDRKIRGMRMMEASGLVFKLLAQSVGGEKYELQNPQATPALLARQMIDEMMPDVTTLDEITDRLHISVTHLIRVFRQKYGITPKQYMLTRQVAYAKMLLTDTQMSISEIAERLSFSDVSYFCAVFRKYVGKTPSQYRNVEKPDSFILK